MGIGKAMDFETEKIDCRWRGQSVGRLRHSVLQKRVDSLRVVALFLQLVPSALPFLFGHRSAEFLSPFRGFVAMTCELKKPNKGFPGIPLDSLSVDVHVHQSSHRGL